MSIRMESFIRFTIAWTLIMVMAFIFHSIHPTDIVDSILTLLGVIILSKCIETNIRLKRSEEGKVEAFDRFLEQWKSNTHTSNDEQNE